MDPVFDTKTVEQAEQLPAPDGSTVRPLCVLPGRASFAQFELGPEQTSRPVSHATVEEIWFVVEGSGQMWRKQDGHEETTGLVPGVCLTIPLGCTFQFRAGRNGLRVVAATTPPWPGTPHEARFEQGPW